MVPVKYMLLIYSNAESWAGLSAEQREGLAGAVRGRGVQLVRFPDIGGRQGALRAGAGSEGGRSGGQGLHRVVAEADGSASRKKTALAERKSHASSGVNWRTSISRTCSPGSIRRTA